MKILCVIPSYYPSFRFGGPVMSTHALNRALVRKGADITVYTTDIGIESQVAVNTCIPIDGVKVTYFCFTKLFEFLGDTGWQFSVSLSQVLKKTVATFDIVYIVALWNYPTLVAAHYCQRYHTPYIVSPRGTLYPYTIKKKFLKKILYYNIFAKNILRNAAGVHYTTEDEANQCHSALGFKNEALVIPNGIDLSQLAEVPPKDALRKHYPFLSNKKVILFVGRIHWIKGLDVLLKGYALLLGKRNDTHLLIVGNNEGGYSNELKKLVGQYNMQDHVTFSGMLIGVRKLEAYGGSDMCVLPSYSENFGLTAIEAMACGLPTIISENVGIAGDVARYNAGFIAKHDPQSLCSAIMLLLDDEQLRKTLIYGGKKLVHECYDIHIVAANMHNAFERIAQRA